MTRIARYILLVLALLLFIAIAPAVVLYAMGYRPPTENNTVAPIGVLLVEALPRRVNVEVAGQAVGRSPRAVPNLTPGPVNVRFSKEGYVPWEKTLTIEPTRATELRGTRLFPENPTRQLLLPRVRLFSLSPNRSLLAVVGADQRLHVVNEAGEALADPITLPDTPQYLLWSPDSTFILTEYAPGVFDTITVTSELVTRTRLFGLRNTSQVQWDPRIPGRLFALTPSGSIISYNAAGQTQSVLLDGVSSFAVGARALYVLTTDNNLGIYSLQGQLIDSRIALPEEAIVEKLLPSGTDELAVLFTDGRLALLDEDGQLQDVATRVQKATWSLDGQMLMLQTGPSELQVYNVDNERQYHIPLQQLYLVVRLSRPITHPEWYAGGQHLIYQVDDQIIITEIDTRDHPLSYTVDATNTGDARVIVGEDGDTIYYLKKMGAQMSIFATSLLTEEDRR